MKLALATLIALLIGCTPRPAFRSGEDFYVRPEKIMFQALAQVDATDAQRLAIMKVWDDTQPPLRKLNHEAEDLLVRWQGMERRDSGFIKETGEMAQRYGEISRERMALSATFDGQVAGTLDDGQWRRWTLFWNNLLRGEMPRRRN